MASVGMFLADSLLEQLVQSVAAAIWERPELAPLRDPVQQALAGKRFKALSRKAWEALADRNDLPAFF